MAGRIESRLEKARAACSDRAWASLVGAMAAIDAWVRANTADAERQAYYRSLVAAAWLPPDDPRTAELCGGSVALQPGDKETGAAVEARIPPNLSAWFSEAYAVVDSLWRETVT